MTSLRGWATLLLAFSVFGWTAYAQLIIGDNYNVPGSGYGFALGTGVNSAINPPSTRLTGLAAPNLRYLSTATKADTAFVIAANKLQVMPAANPGRFTFSANGTTPFDFGPILGVNTATPQNPRVYDLTISMANDSAGVQRFSFALANAEGDATTWDFGLQLYRTADSDNFYTIGKRVDTAASGLASDLNSFITNTAPGTYGSEVTFLMRITDAGSEATTFNSRVQLSMDGGLSWFYDSSNDPDLPNGWHLSGSGRFILWDVAPNAGPVTYDNLSLVRVSASPVLVSPQSDASNLGASPTLQVALSNAAAGPFTVTFYGREVPNPYPGPDFAVAVLPDTQNYAREASGVGDAVKEEWFAQTEWIVTNRVIRNIAYVAHLGDIVQNGDIKNGGANTTEWRNATNAMYRLENPARALLREGIPYGLAVGNHDQEPNGDLDGTTTNYNNYFGIDHFAGRPYYGGHFSSNNDNHYDLFSASGLDFIVLYFEFGRYGTTILNWANGILAAYPNRRAIVVTHYSGSDSTPSNLSTQGQALYDGLKENTNFFMMLGGHVFNNGGEGSRANSYEGRTVRTFISDYQGRTNGGNGWMRVMYFSPSNNTVNIKTYSPWIDKYETDANSQIAFAYNLQLPGGPGSPGTPYRAIGTNSAVAPASIASCVWPGLQSKKTYEWFVTIADQTGTVTTNATWTFTTSVNSAPVAPNRLITLTGDQPTNFTLLASDPNGDALTFRTNTIPLEGRITAFDTNSGLITYLPARGFRGTDRFTWAASDSVASSPVATLNLTVVAPPDSNANGLPDDWETLFGVTSPEADDDHDGQNNLSEYLANTNPTNAASALRILSAARLPAGDFSFTWASVGGIRYRVQYSDGSTNNSGGFAFTDIERPIDLEMDRADYGLDSTQSFTDALSPATNSMRYYRVQVVP